MDILKAISIIICLPVISMGQSPDNAARDTVYPLPEIVTIYRMSEKTPPSAYANDDLSKSLRYESSITLKDYGPGSLSTISLRGHSASQTNITLDGFSLQSNMNGVYDLSLIPAYFISGAKARPGATSASATGSIGGELSLQSDDVFANDRIGIQYAASYGSYRNMGHYFSMKNNWPGKKKIQSVFKIFHKRAKNNFPYTYLNQAGTPRRKLPNSDYAQFGLLQNNSIGFMDGSLLKTHFWYVDNSRGIPPNQLQSDSDTRQYDELINGILSWEKSWSDRSRGKISARYLNEHIFYDSPGIVTDSRAVRYEARGEFSCQIKDSHIISSFVGYEHSQARVDDYESDTPREDRTYGQVQYDLDYKKWNFRTQLKGEIVQGMTAPVSLAVSGGRNWELRQGNLEVSAALSRNVRRPTFNDLYWGDVGGASGNPDLNAEKSWRQEAGVEWRRRYWHTKVAGYHSLVEDWILWAPNEVGKWIPENIKTVRSRGIDATIGHQLWADNDWGVTSELNYHLTQTTNSDVTNGNQHIIGKQLAYIPLHSADFSCSLSYKDFRWEYKQLINGKRYTATDNSLFIEPFTVADVSMSYTFKFKKWDLSPLLEINNVFNAEYQMVVRRPLPPTHFNFTLDFNFSN